MRIIRNIIVGVAGTTMMGFYGCGSNFDSGSATSETSPAQQQVTALGFVGSQKCMECHEGFSWSSGAVSNYLASKHVVHSTHVTAKSGQVCLQCHDPIGDGPLIQGRIGAADVPADGLATVGCENCHGTGKDHYGIGPIPKAIPDAATCGKCHDKQWSDIPEAAGHITFHPEGYGIYSDYAASAHSAAPGSHNAAPCAKCHTDEGGRLYKNIHTVEGLSTVQPVENASPPQCRTCHDAHNPGKLLEDATSSASAQYNTCTNCHQPHDAAIGDTIKQLPGSTSTDGSSGKLIYHAGRWGRVISSTHYDNPATTDIIEGYNLDPKSDRVCLNCHNVHSADITINKQWASSAHGGKILDAKTTAAASQANNTLAQVKAVRAAGADGTTGAAWVNEGYGGASDACKRCHTATGAAGYLNGPATYDPTKLDFSYLKDGQREMLYCWGCHKDNSGNLRKPGAIKATYKFNGALATFPDADSSNTCIACHSGRESGESVQAITNFANANFKNSHYMAAAGLMYVKVGYRNFVPLSTPIGTTTYGATLTSSDDGGAISSTHRKFGTAAIIGDHGITDQMNMSTGGPCVTCHMADRTDNNGKRSHTLEIDANAFNAVCINCHTTEGTTTLTGDNFIDAFVDEQSVPFQDALNLAKAKLVAKGITYDGTVYPYFFLNASPHTSTTGVTDWTLGGTVDGEKMMGACFNINLLSREPAAYVHARTYTRRLIYDTIDWLDNQTIDRSVSATAQAWNPTTYASGTDANATNTTASMKYLRAYNRTTGAWSNPERP